MWLRLSRSGRQPSATKGVSVIGLQREAYICKRAYELASSGLHIEPLTVVSILVEEGFPEAVDLLKIEDIRRDLHVTCAQNWRGARRH